MTISRGTVQLLIALGLSFCNPFCFSFLISVILFIFKYVKHDMIIKIKPISKVIIQRTDTDTLLFPPHSQLFHSIPTHPLLGNQSSFWFIFLVFLFTQMIKLYGNIYFLSLPFLDQKIACHRQCFALCFSLNNISWKLLYRFIDNLPHSLLNCISMMQMYQSLFLQSLP